MCGMCGVGLKREAREAGRMEERIGERIDFGETEPGGAGSGSSEVGRGRCRRCAAMRSPGASNATAGRP